jgi:hypothetical protein
MKAIVAYSHLMEFIPGRVSSFSGIMLFFDGMVLVVSPVILKLISKNTDVLLYVPLSINLGALIIFAIFYIPESTKYLLEKGRFEEAKRDIDYINRINRASVQQIVQIDSMLIKLSTRYKNLSMSPTQSRAMQ